MPRFAALAALPVIAVGARHGGLTLVTIVAVVGVVLAMFGVSVATLRRSRLSWDGVSVCHRGLWRITDLGSPSELRVTMVELAAPDATRDVQVWSNGRSVVVLAERTWTPDALDRAAASLNVPRERGGETWSLSELERRFPGALPWPAAHPRIAYGALAVVTVGGILAAATWR